MDNRHRPLPHPRSAALLRGRLLLVLITALLVAAAGAPVEVRAQAGHVKSARTGTWSDPTTWTTRSVPRAGASVTISAGTTVEYDVVSDQEIASLDIYGTLVFSRARSTRLDVGNVFVRDGGVFEMGTARQAIPAGVVSELRFVVPAGAVFAGGEFAEGDVGLWIFPGGRWDAHGAPVRQTWGKLNRPARAGDSALIVSGDLSDWPKDAMVVVTPTSMNPGESEFEERAVRTVRRDAGGRSTLTVNAPLAHDHAGGAQGAGEVALLTRNVRITSKYPDRPKAHTMFMERAKGHVAYTEFKDLGTFGVLGRYPLHFHRMGDSSRGMVVRGVSVWRSGNHFLNIHGSNGVTIESAVGYDTPGSGFFIEALRGPAGVLERNRSRSKADRQDREARPPDAAAGDKQRAKQQRRAGQEQQGRRKGDQPAGNLDFVFAGNLAARGFWKPGSLDDENRVSLFWIAALNGRLVGNVAVGARGGRSNSGFHFAEHADISATHPPLLMLANESRSNTGHGLFSWTNSKLDIEIIGFHAWRNGRAGITLGAYNHRARLFRVLLSENGDSNASVWVLRTWIQDSIFERAPTGLRFNRHQLPGLPEDPSMIIRTSFSGHSHADITQDHTPCPSPGEEQSPASRRCPPNFARFIGSQFASPRPIDFGWHENAHSWMDVINWPGRPSGLPPAFRLGRRDQAEGGHSPIFDATMRPLATAWDMPPTVDLSVQESRSGEFILRGSAADDRGVVAVEFLADGQVIHRSTQAPYQFTWRPPAAGRRAFLYARALDTTGQVAYSQPVPLPAGTP